MGLTTTVAGAAADRDNATASPPPIADIYTRPSSKEKGLSRGGSVGQNLNGGSNAGSRRGLAVASLAAEEEDNHVRDFNTSSLDQQDQSNSNAGGNSNGVANG
jgi:hypothetical protein